MKKILILLALVAGVAHSGEDPTIGHIYLPTEEIEFYNNGAGCIIPHAERNEIGGMRMARYPYGNRSKYVMGCWKAIDTDRLRAVFEDGVIMILQRKQLIPVGQEDRRFSL